MAVGKQSINAGPPRPPRAVVCATDFSFVSAVACDAGALLARRYQTRLIIVHVVARRSEMRQAQERLIAEMSVRLSGVSATTAVAVGDPAREISRLARQEAADLILIGRHPGVEPLVQVGIESGLAETAPCPVIALASAADVQVLVASYDRTADVRCLVCGRPLGEQVCFGCRSVISWQAMEHRWSHELHEGPGLMGLGGARALGPLAGAPEPASAPSTDGDPAPEFPHWFWRAGRPR
jgi:nucleotide-binding universal stress UspA family protein